MLNDNLIKKLKESDRYGSFTYLDEPADFGELFAGRDYDTVQVHDMTPVGNNDIVGFAGVFRWTGGVVFPLDGDIYTKHATVHGYEEFESDGKKCLDILCEEW